jgi:hypothetical protein
VGVDVTILDGGGVNAAARTTENGAALVQCVPVSARGVSKENLASLRVLEELFTTAAGASDQAVDGSTTNVVYCISSEVGVTKWIHGFRMVIKGASLDITSNQLRRYSSLAAPGLTNGIEIETFQSGETTSVAVTPIKTIADFFPYESDHTNLPGAISASEDMLTIDFTFDAPVVLLEGGSDKIIIRIRDDMTAALSSTNAEQYAIAHGYKESTT